MINVNFHTIGQDTFKVKGKFFDKYVGRPTVNDFAQINISNTGFDEVTIFIDSYEQMKDFMNQMMEQLPQMEAQWYRTLKERGELPAENEEIGVIPY